jgi:hypothetical protein
MLQRLNGFFYAFQGFFTLSLISPTRGEKKRRTKSGLMLESLYRFFDTLQGFF